METKKLRILPVPSLKEVFHGKTGSLIGVKEVITALEAWDMYTVELDEMVPTNGVDGYIEHKFVNLPSTCFEEIVNAQE